MFHNRKRVGERVREWERGGVGVCKKEESDGFYLFSYLAAGGLLQALLGLAR